ncbi:MAG: DUF167 domain-containing protein [Candidatus Taylorbacteria bacterium]
MYIKVRAQAGVTREKIIEKSMTHFEICVKEMPIRNLANKRIIEIISKKFKVPPNKVRIISGHRSPSKILSVDDVSE